MGTIRQGNKLQNVVQPGHVLQVNANGDGLGWASAPGTVAIAPGQTIKFGPYGEPTSVTLECYSGSLEYEIKSIVPFGAESLGANASFAGVGATLAGVVKISQADYDALGTPDPNVLYVIPEA